FNEHNRIKLLKRIDDFGDIDICYKTDPEKPVLVLKATIHAHPLTYKRYLTSSSTTPSEITVTGANQ
ncbi:hypothetical protein DFQ29_003047, partial [Apophysomyces sp. BC1021]